MTARGRRSTGTPILLAVALVAAALLVVGFAASAVARKVAADRIVVSARAAEGTANGTVARSGGGLALRAKMALELAVRTREESAAAAAAAAKKREFKKRQVLLAASKTDAYKGLGSWVDIYDDRAWADPGAAVRDMAAHGVRTLFVETSNSRSSSAFKDEAGLKAFIRAAHANKLKVVAWYLPDLQDVSMDFGRISQAIALKTADGQKFDSFALDIESTNVSSVSARNAALTELSTKIRTSVGDKYPLGAIIPSPMAIDSRPAFWTPFPYESLAKTYDVFVPMSYYTYHGNGGAAALADTLANVRALRSHPGCATEPIHLIGGIAEDSTDFEVRAFVQAGLQEKVYGASLYGWPGTTPAHWAELKAVR